MTIPPPQFTLFYDGLCPICQAEVAWLRRCNRQGRLILQDINAPDFQAEAYGKTYADMLAEIHGLQADGTLLIGMPVFRAAYQAVGLGWLLAPTGWPLLSPAFALLYRLFARYRLGIGSRLGGGRCTDGQCGIGKPD